MSVVLQLSDLHFGTEAPEVVKGLRELAHSLRPELVIVSGDITQRARRAQFAAARRFCDALADSVLLSIPGNHDLPLFQVFARLLSPYGQYRRVFGSPDGFVHRSESLLVIGLNTTRWWRHVHGEVSRAQVEQVTGLLSQAGPTQLRIVVTHQPVHVVRLHDERNLLRGAGRALEAWVAAGVDLILGGHIHVPHLRPLSERYPGLTREAWSLQAGTATSTRVRQRAPNSVNVVRVNPPGERACRVERWDYTAAARQFLLVESTPLQFAPTVNAGVSEPKDAGAYPSR